MKYNFNISKEVNPLVPKFNLAFLEFFEELKSQVGFETNSHQSSELRMDAVSGMYTEGVFEYNNDYDRKSKVSFIPRFDGTCDIKWQFKGMNSGRPDNSWEEKTVSIIKIWEKVPEIKDFFT